MKQTPHSTYIDSFVDSSPPVSSALARRLPTVRQTASDLGVAAGTAAKAYKLLERDGLVVTRTAAGTRVAESAAVLPHAVIRHIRDLIAAADANGANFDDVIDVLRVVWQASTSSSIQLEDGGELPA